MRSGTPICARSPSLRSFFGVTFETVHMFYLTDVSICPRGWVLSALKVVKMSEPNSVFVKMIIRFLCSYNNQTKKPGEMKVTGRGLGNHLQILSVGTDTVHLCLSTVYDVPYLLHCLAVIWKRHINVRILKPLNLFVFLFSLACEKIFIKKHSIESRCYRTGTYTVCGRVAASFSPEILQAGQWGG